MRFPAAKFEAFCRQLILSSKELGRCRFRWNGCQRYFVEELTRGLEDGQHRLVVLKARQLGITTVTGSLDLFWAFRTPGVQGALVYDKEPTREQLRAILDAYLTSLPPGMRRGVTKNNRVEVAFDNRSRLTHIIASGRSSGKAGRSQGLNYLHGTEVSGWEGEETLVALEACLAERNEDRLYVFESTALGFNGFYDLWETACAAPDQRAVFIGWWRNELYRLPRTGRLFDVYTGRPSQTERKMLDEVKSLFDYELDVEQLAWWRWKWAASGESRLLFAEYPWVPEQAFQLSGECFFPLDRVEQGLRKSREHTRKCYTYNRSATFEGLTLAEDRDGPLSVWEEPRPGAWYVVAADPAFGESQTCDHGCVQVLRVTAAEAIQVAEFDSPEPATYQFAWIIAHLCGAYSTPSRPVTMILELSGPGRAVYGELRRMRQQYGHAMTGLTERARGKLEDLFGSISDYLYRREDSLSGGLVMQWETTYRTKQTMMNLLRDTIDRGTLRAKSPEFWGEARYVTQTGSRIGAEGSVHKDDRVIAMALALIAWQQQVLPAVLESGAEAAAAGQSVYDRTVQHYLSRMQDERTEADLASAGAEPWQTNTSVRPRGQISL